MENETIEQKFVRIRKIFADEMRKVYNCDIEEDDLTNSQLACHSLMIDIACKEIINITNNEIQKLRNQREYQFDRVDKHYEEINRDLVEKVEKLNNNVKKGTEEYSQLVKKNKQDINDFEDTTLARITKTNSIMLFICASICFGIGYIVGGGQYINIAKYGAILFLGLCSAYCFYDSYANKSGLSGVFAGFFSLAAACVSPYLVNLLVHF